MMLLSRFMIASTCSAWSAEGYNVHHRKFKKLNKETDNLRDHMVDLELIFTMLGEASTTEIARNKNAQGYKENFNAATEGGTVAGSARQDLEKKSGKRIASRENFRQISEAVQRKKLPGKTTKKKS